MNGLRTLVAEELGELVGEGVAAPLDELADDRVDDQRDDAPAIPGMLRANQPLT